MAVWRVEKRYGSLILNTANVILRGWCKDVCR